MRNFFGSLAIAALATPAFAQDADAAMIGVDTVLGTTIEQVTATLADMGYEVRETETEDARMEIYFVGDGRMGEVHVSRETGKPTKIEME